MSDTTLETPHVLSSEGKKSTRAPGSPGARSFVARHAWWFVALGIVVLSAAIIRITNTRPGYDPYGWLDWGYQTLRGSLNLGGAPSWKPFSYLFTVPYSIFGHYALWLWILTAVSLSISGAVFGGRIAYKLTSADAEQRWVPWVAAVFAGVSVLGIQDYFHYILSVQSDPMLVAVCLAAIDCHLSGRHRWAWALAALASLGRPEVWPFAGLYAISAFRKYPSMRWMLYTGVLINVFLWFGVPEITNGRPNIAGQLALRSPRELHQNKVVGTFDRYAALDFLPLEIAALITTCLAILRRNWTVVTLAGMVVAWVVIEIAFALHGFPGVPRYLFEPAALTAVLAGIFVGWALTDLSWLHSSIPRWAGVALAGVLVVSMVPDAINEARKEHKDVYHERQRTTEINKLSAAIHALGGSSAIRRCGEPVVNVEYVSILAWYVHLNTGFVGHRPAFELRQKYPIVMFTPFPNGWGIKPYRSKPNLASTCAKLNSIYVPTAFHPHGVLIPKGS